MVEYIYNFLIDIGASEAIANYLAWIAAVTTIIILSIIVNYVAKKVLVQIIARIIRRSRTRLDDYFLEHKVFSRLSHIAPALVIYFYANIFPENIADYIVRLSTIYMIFTGVLVLSAFLNAIVDLYRTTEASKQKPIKGYVQIVKVIVYIFVAIYSVGIILNQSVWPILTGLGAMTAIILLIFKDSLLGLVSSVQISANDMVRIGDWLEMPKYGADGDVIDITLTTVKVQNWDKTISYIPAYALISDSFRNWRGMEESGGRRIKRAININIHTIKYATPELLEKWKKFDLLKDYIQKRLDEIEKYNKETGIDDSQQINRRRLTNIGTFRHYCIAYLKNHPQVNENMTLMVRQKPITQYGLPIEVYVFSKDQEWVAYETIQSNIFDHLLAALPEFELRVYQNRTDYIDN